MRMFVFVACHRHVGADELARSLVRNIQKVLCEAAIPHFILELSAMLVPPPSLSLWPEPGSGVWPVAKGVRKRAPPLAPIAAPPPLAGRPQEAAGAESVADVELHAVPAQVHRDEALGRPRDGGGAHELAAELAAAHVLLREGEARAVAKLCPHRAERVERGARRDLRSRASAREPREAAG